MWPPHGIEPREGAELRKRDSVCQRSSQGAQAPQRSARAKRGRDSLPRHLELTRTSAKGSFSFTEGFAETVSRNIDSEWDVLSALSLFGKARPGITRNCGMHFPVGPAGGKRIPLLSEKAGRAFRRARASQRAGSSPSAPDIPPSFASLCRPFGRLSARAGILKTILILCNTMRAKPARFEGGRDGEDSRR